MDTKKNSRAIGFVVALLGCGLALIALVGQVVSAQSGTPALKPPFKFAEGPAAPQTQNPPPGSTVLLTETFGASFAPTTTLQGSTPLWRVSANADDTARYYWGRVGSGAFSNSAWSATRPITTAPMLNPGTSPYPAGQDTWLIYGPFDLSKFIYAHLSFEYYLNSQAGDTLLWGFSTDGQTFYGNSQSGSLGKWITDTFAFRSNRSFQTVYLAFAFNSHNNPLGIGAFVRNVRLTAEPLKYIYMPVVTNNYPPPLYGPYAFDSGTTDIDHWGGAYYDPGSIKFGQCVTGQCAISTKHPNDPHGNPGNSLRLYTNGLYNFVATSPNDIAPDNYDLYVDISPYLIYPKGACSPFGCPDNDLGDWYGIIFNASSDNTTFGANPSQFIYNTKYYRLYFYNVDSVRPIAIRLDKCTGDGNNPCQTLKEKNLPLSFIGNACCFDTVHIQRLASGYIEVWLNGTSVLTASDPTYTTSNGFGKYGVFIFSWTRNDTSDPPTGTEMQVDFDNIRLYQR